MKTLKAYLKLFRWPNLVIMALTQILFRYAIILPAFQARGLDATLSHFDFIMLVLATMLISAAAYAINDYFDLRIDRINKPQRIILGREISRRRAILWHSLLNILGVVIGVYISWRIQYWQLALVFLAIPALLWLYSIRYKRKFLVGNLVVAFLSAFVVGIVWVVEYRSMAAVPHVEMIAGQISLFAGIFAFFAFFSTLIREIIKDVEDVKGDARSGCKTVPVVMGIRGTRRLLLVMILGMMAFVGYSQVLLVQEGYMLLFVWLLLLVQVPLLGLLIQNVKATSAGEFRRMQYLMKFIMVTGIFSMVILSLYL
ncbi:MAG: geranylgeranylglycerol-phosphate geranylgeranyltransferase [Bacteroidales bacterium]